MFTLDWLKLNKREQSPISHLGTFALLVTAPFSPLVTEGFALLNPEGAVGHELLRPVGVVEAAGPVWSRSPPRSTRSEAPVGRWYHRAHVLSEQLITNN